MVYIYSPFCSLQNAVCFIILTYFVPVLFKFYLQAVLKLKKNNSGVKRLNAVAIVIRLMAGRSGVRITLEARNFYMFSETSIPVISRVKPLYSI